MSDSPPSESVAADRPPGPGAEGGHAPVADPPVGPAPVADAPVGPGPTAHPAGSSPRPDPERAADEADLLVEEAEQALVGDVDDLARVVAERDEYLDRLQRLQADFENYKKRIIKQQTEHLERAAEDLVARLLPVLDNFDLALAHGAQDLEPVYRSLLDVLEGGGLGRIDPDDGPFDPNEHDAVIHEPGDQEPAEPGGQVVTEVLRAGYRWKGRVLRPAMVKVKG